MILATPLARYSPDYTPIEKLWSKVKTYLHRVAARNEDLLYSALGEALESVTPRILSVGLKRWSVRNASVNCLSC
jgi:transposase